MMNVIRNAGAYPIGDLDCDSPEGDTWELDTTTLVVITECSKIN